MSFRASTSVGTASIFNSDIADLVAEVTDDKKLSKEERKKRQVELAATKTDRAKILKLADKTSNLRSLAKSPPTDWSVQRRREYLDWATAVTQGLRGVSPWLEARIDEAAEQLGRSLLDIPRPDTEHRCGYKLFTGGIGRLLAELHVTFTS